MSTAAMGSTGWKPPGKSFIKTVAVVLGMCAAAAAASYFTPRAFYADQRPKFKLEDVVPQQLGDWKVDPSVPVVVVDPTALEVINKIYQDTLSRTYVNSRGERVMLSIAYGADQSEKMQVHTPEFCYPAQGFKISPSSELAVPMGEKTQPVVRLIATHDYRVEPITYWVVMGEHIVNGGPKDRRNARFMYGFKGIIPDGVFFRISSIGSNTDEQYQVQQRFLADLSNKLSPAARDLLFGKQAF